MDTLLSQLKGQGSPFPSPSPISNADKLLDTIHLLSQATLLVAQQLQERKQPVKAKPTDKPTGEKRLSTSLPTPKPSPPPTVKKASPRTPTALSLSWVPRAPEHYSPPSKTPPFTAPITGTPTTGAPVTAPPPPEKLPTPTPITTPTPRPIKQLRKPNKRSTPPNPTPQTLTQPTPTPAPTNMPTPPPTTLPTPSIAQIEKPATAQTTPPPPLPYAKAENIPDLFGPAPAPKTFEQILEDTSARLKKLGIPNPFNSRSYIDDAPANHIVDFPHSYDQCPRLPDCPSHKLRFNAYLKASIPPTPPDPTLSCLQQQVPGSSLRTGFGTL